MTLDVPLADRSAPRAPADAPKSSASFPASYRRFWQRCTVFTGRAGRAEYWWAALGNAVVLAALAVLLLLALAVRVSLDGSALRTVPAALAGVLGLLLALFALALIVPSIAVSVRRLHDVGLPGWLVLLPLVPGVGWPALLVLHMLPASPVGARPDAAGGIPSAGPEQVGPAPAAASPAFDVWPGADAAEPPTAPLATRPQPEPEPGGASGIWSGVGAVVPLTPALSAPPAWRDRDHLLITRPDAPDLLATDGLRSREGATVLGPGAELFLTCDPATDPSADPAGDWRFATLATVARRVAAAGPHLPSELEQYGTLSMTLTGIDAPAALRTPDGRLGVLLGLPRPGVPEAVATPEGEVRLVSITPLTPSELQQIVDGGSAARRQVAGRLAALPAAALAARTAPA